MRPRPPTLLRMTDTGRTAVRIIGWALLPIALLVTFVPVRNYGFTWSVWTYEGSADQGYPWSYNAMEWAAPVLVLAGIIAVAGLVAIVLSYKLPDHDG